MNTLIQNKVDDYTASDEPFTSVDIANSIKADGTWIRNSEVAAFLRTHAVFPGTYARTWASVTLADGSVVQATVYASPGAVYDKTDQRAMTPDEFKTLHGRDPFSLSDFSLDGTNDNDVVQHSDSKKDAIKRIADMFKFPK